MPVDCLQVPKVLFQMEKYKNLSNTAKILYSLFLDRLKFAVQRYDYFCKLQAKSIIFIAVIAHSSPLLPSLPPARSSACSIVLVVINP